MNVKYVTDTGSRHEWTCIHCDSTYLVTFHYVDATWSVHRIRKDGEREIIERHEAETFFQSFPREEALQRIEVSANPKQERSANGSP